MRVPTRRSWGAFSPKSMRFISKYFRRRFRRNRPKFSSDGFVGRFRRTLRRIRGQFRRTVSSEVSSDSSVGFVGRFRRRFRRIRPSVSSDGFVGGFVGFVGRFRRTISSDRFVRFVGQLHRTISSGFSSGFVGIRRAFGARRREGQSCEQVGRVDVGSRSFAWTRQGGPGSHSFAWVGPGGTSVQPLFAWVGTLGEVPQLCADGAGRPEEMEGWVGRGKCHTLWTNLETTVGQDILTRGRRTEKHCNVKSIWRAWI